MKNVVRTSGVILVILSIFFIHSCKKDKPTPPVITTTVVTAISQTTATSGGEVTDEGGAPIVSRGVCWSTTQNPTTTNSKTTDGSGTGTFASNITGLTANTTYYVRAYATNSAGTGYGNQVSFTTSPVVIATLATDVVTSITSTTAVSGGNISADGGGAITARGVCWGTTANPTTSNDKTTDNSGTGSFVSNITGLQPVTKYYVRSYATNSAGTAYGNELNFTTSAALATLTTTDISNITSTSAKSGGNISNDGGASVTVRGVCWSTLQNPTIADNKTTDGSGTGSFTSNLTGLNAGTIYYVRAYATNIVGTNYGNQISFTTSIKTVTCTAGCSTMSWGISGETGSSYYSMSCTYNYVGYSYIKTCTGTITFTNSGNSYSFSVIYDWPACRITIEVTGVGTCTHTAGGGKSLNDFNCGEQQVTEKLNQNHM